MLHKRRSLGTRKVSPPQPTCMTDDQKATYLDQLRNSRPARPGGARPLPGKATTGQTEYGQNISRSGSALSFNHGEQTEDDTKRNSIPQSNSMPVMAGMKGRPLVQAPSTTPQLRGQNTHGGPISQPGQIRYREITSRELEKQEAHKLREQLQAIDHADEETRIYVAAQSEAADLVWKHLNPRLAEHEKTAAYRNPDIGDKGKNRANRTSHTVSQQQGITSKDFAPNANVEHEDCRVEGLRLSKRGSRDEQTAQQPSGMGNNRRRSSGKRVTSNDSSKGVFRNPEDQIYEEPEEIEGPHAKQDPSQDLPLQSRQRNSLPRGSRPLPDKINSVPLPERLKYDRFEIFKNPPTQLRKADYTANPPSREATPEIETPKGRAMEIRSDEIRAATSMKRKDRSPKLPTPTAVSDRAGRPIVSFDPAWKPGNESPKTSLDFERSPSKPMPPAPVTARSAPVVPTINLPEENIPSINLPDEDPSIPSISIAEAPSIPAISLPEDATDSRSTVPSINVPDNKSVRPLPQINASSDPKPKPRPLPSHTHSSPAKLPPTDRTRTNRVPWLSRGPATTNATVTCNACDLPIAGRIVTASGSSASGMKVRFHPECFTCHHCSTKLECVSFYPEPEAARNERLEQDQEADSSEMRFYCHLDYHDLFSPRCASCKTPIEGAVILAAGKSWHEGHFFCAECGDPFSSTSPFVEDKGYAYCVGCHTKRTSARCRMCKKQILDDVCVEALDGKWHEECFRCDDCSGDFGEDGRFFVREVEVELTEKEKRKGLTKKLEERAVCQRCEELRLRRVDAFL